MRRHAPWILILLLSSALLPTCGQRTPEWNLILITIDTLRADRVGCYGDSSAHTPTLDRLAREGVVFENASAVVPVTLPSHTAILTGYYPPRSGVRNNGTYFLEPAVTTLAERLRDAGYRTGAFVSAFVLERQFGLDQGFEAYDDTLYNERPGDRTFARALEWLDASDGRPSFLWVHIYEPHTPWTPPHPYATLPLPTGYEREVAAADGMTGDFLEALSRRGLTDRSLLAVLSDHGEGLMDHGEFEHGIFLYGETMRIPWILRFPDSRHAGERVPHLVSTVDLVPSVMDWMGLPIPEGLDGVSLRPVLEEGVAPGRHGVYLETLYPQEALGWSPLFAFETDRWKWIEAPRPELYNLAEDPRELQNRSASDPDTAARLGRRLERARIGFQPLASGSARQLSPEEEERLRSLGYLSGDPQAAAEAENLPDPKDMIVFHKDFEKGKRAVDDGRFADAVEPFRRILAAQPQNLTALLGLGIAYNRTARFQQAEEVYRRALEISPGNVTALEGLGDALFGQERWGDALEQYRECAAQASASSRVFTRAALCLHRMGRGDEGDAILERNARDYPPHAEEIAKVRGQLADWARFRAAPPADSVRLARARSAANLGFLRESEELLKAPLDDPQLELLRLRLLETLYVQSGRRELALDVVRRIQSRGLEGLPAGLREADYLLALHRDAEALARYDELIEESGPELASGLGGIHYNRACALSRMDRRNEAVQALVQAVEHGYDRLGHMLGDEDLAPLRQEEGFQQLTQRMAEKAR